MSTYYDFMVEAKYKDKWHNIDLHTKDFDGKLRHQYLATFSRSFVGQLESLIDGAWRIGFGMAPSGVSRNPQDYRQHRIAPVERYLHTLQGYWIGGDSVYFPLDHQNRSSMRHRSGFPIGQQSCGRRLQGIDAAAFRQNPLYVGRCCAICLYTWPRP